MAENIENNGCSQRDNAEHEGYVKASRSFNRIWKERDSAQPRLLEAILYKDNFNRAYKRVKANKGALGIEGMTIEEALPYLKEHQQEITDRIYRGKYTPSPVRRVEISKPDGGVRKLGIPTVIDRTLQQAITQLIVIDGTKIHAQNSKHNCITQSGLDKKIEYAEAQINAYLMAIAKDEVPADDLTDKLKTYQELKEQYLTQKQELKDEGLEQKSLTDPDSRRMKNNGSLDICYNVQSVVDAKNHFVVDISTTNDINDQNQLYTMAQKASELLEKESSTVLADTGYYNGTEIKKCVDAGMNVFIKKAKANNATKDNEFRKEKFIYNGKTDEYTCPAGNRLRFFENTSKNGMKYRKYKCTDCSSCKYKKDCTTSSSGRTIQRWVHEDVLETVYNETLNNNEVYKQRRCIVEHPFGTIKRSLGYNFFLRRRQENVDAEAASMFIAYNFKRLLSMFSTEELVMRFE